MDHLDKARFATLLAQLGEVFGRKITPQLAEIYWGVLSNLAYESFDFAVKWHINNGEHFPKPAEFRSALQFKPKPAVSPAIEQHYPKWMELVNNLFFVWLAREVNSGNRVSNGVTIPELEMHERRAACCRLADDFELMERERDPSANRDWLKQAFDRQMALIPVSNPSA